VTNTQRPLSVAFSVLRNASDAEDAVQESSYAFASRGTLGEIRDHGLADSHRLEYCARPQAPGENAPETDDVRTGTRAARWRTERRAARRSCPVHAHVLACVDQLPTKSAKYWFCRFRGTLQCGDSSFLHHRVQVRSRSFARATDGGCSNIQEYKMNFSTQNNASSTTEPLRREETLRLIAAYPLQIA